MMVEEVEGVVLQHSGLEVVHIMLEVLLLVEGVEGLDNHSQVLHMLGVVLHKQVEVVLHKWAVVLHKLVVVLHKLVVVLHNLVKVPHQPHQNIFSQPQLSLEVDPDHYFLHYSHGSSQLPKRTEIQKSTNTFSLNFIKISFISHAKYQNV